MDVHRAIIVNLLWQITVVSAVENIGVNWGMQASHRLPPNTVVKLLKDNGFQKVKLFDADWEALNALRNSGIEVMVGIPNSMLYTLANSIQAAENWVVKNVSGYVSDGVSIRYVAVGNEPFLTTLNGTYLNTTMPAVQNIQAAVVKAGLGEKISVTVPLNADVYESPTTRVPSGGDFRGDIRDIMLKMVQFYNQTGAPFTVNIHSFISLYNDPNFPFDYAFFDGYNPPLIDRETSCAYENVFDANYDTLVSALERHGYGDLPIIIGEIGWPTDGDVNANRTNAKRFIDGFIRHSAKGTPRRPGRLNAYFFSLIDEDMKSVQPGNFERHWGMFSYDGSPKYDVGYVPAVGVRFMERKWCVMSPSASLFDANLADSVGYACAHGDCTSLGEWTSCRNLDARGNVSYAFNNYYQQNNQDESACRFADLSMMTTVDPSAGDCKFAIMIDSSASMNRTRRVFFVVVFLVSMFAFR